MEQQVVNNNMEEKISDHRLKGESLCYWANHIETGNAVLSASDAINMKRSDIVKPLSEQQQDFVLRLRRLAQEELSLG